MARIHRVPPPVLKPPDRAFALYLALFFAAWSAYVLFGYPRIQTLGDYTLAYALAGLVVRLLLWVSPAVWMAKFVDGVEPLRALGLVNRWRRGVLIGLLFASAQLSLAFVQLGRPHDIGRHVTWNNVLGAALAVGFAEEIPFRGYILPKLARRLNFWIANGLTSLLFVAMHLPGWLLLHRFQPSLVLRVFVFSFVLGALFRYSRSLWSCIIIHDVNDLISVVLYAGK